METEMKNIKTEDLTQLIQDIALIKNILLSEGELSDWAKKELKNARETPGEEYISMEEIEKEFL